MEINKVYNIDNLELLRKMKSESVDLIYCDILYNTGKKFKDYNDNLGTPQQAVEWYRPRLIEMKRVLKNNGNILLQMDYRLVHYLKVEMDNIFGINNFINEIIWYYKSPSGTSTKKLAKGTKKQAKNKNVSFGRETVLNPKGKTPTDVWEISTLNSMAKERVGYDTQKPKQLIERIIKGFSNEGDIVADFFCGSGTSLVVAKELGRNYIGCDINPRAIEITNQRLEDVNKLVS